MAFKCRLIFAIKFISLEGFASTPFCAFMSISVMMFILSSRRDNFPRMDGEFRASLPRREAAYRFHHDNGMCARIASSIYESEKRPCRTFKRYRQLTHFAHNGPMKTMPGSVIDDIPGCPNHHLDWRIARAAIIEKVGHINFAN